ncbi:hypothetical protein ACFSVJ_27165 [Prauserella oleivorans]
MGTVVGRAGENLRYVVLPVLALALAEFPSFYRLVRSDVVSTLQTDFVRTATVRGCLAGTSSCGMCCGPRRCRW